MPYSWVSLLVLFLALRVFLLVPQFSSLHKISIFYFDENRRPAWNSAKADVASSLNILIYLFSLHVLKQQLYVVFSGTLGYAESSYWATGKADNKLWEDKNHSYKNIWACNQKMWVSGTTMGEGWSVGPASCTFLSYFLCPPLVTPRFWFTSLRLSNCCPKPLEVNWNKWR